MRSIQLVIEVDRMSEILRSPTPLYITAGVGPGFRENTELIRIFNWLIANKLTLNAG